MYSVGLDRIKTTIICRMLKFICHNRKQTPLRCHDTAADHVGRGVRRRLLPNACWFTNSIDTFWRFLSLEGMTYAKCTS